MTRLVARSMKPVVPVSNIIVVFSFPAVYKDRDFITSAFFGLADMIAGKKKVADGEEYRAFITDVEKRFEETVAALSD